MAQAQNCILSFFTHGGIAQLGERLTGSQEVSGSIPLISTKTDYKAKVLWSVFLQKNEDLDTENKAPDVLL